MRPSAGVTGSTQDWFSVSNWTLASGRGFEPDEQVAVTTVALDGITVLGAEDRIFRYDSVPAAQISQVVLNKTLLPDMPAELLRAVREHKKAADRLDVEMMRLGVHWADLHLADPEYAEACFTSPKTFAGEGSPSIDEFCVPEFATMLGRSNDSAGRFLTDCVEVAYRLPRLWGAVLSGLVAGWRARIIAQTTLAVPAAKVQRIVKPPAALRVPAVNALA